MGFWLFRPLGSILDNLQFYSSSARSWPFLLDIIAPPLSVFCTFTWVFGSEACQVWSMVAFCFLLSDWWWDGSGKCAPERWVTYNSSEFYIWICVTARVLGGRLVVVSCQRGLNIELAALCDGGQEANLSISTAANVPGCAARIIGVGVYGRRLVTASQHHLHLWDWAATQTEKRSLTVNTPQRKDNVNYSPHATKKMKFNWANEIFSTGWIVVPTVCANLPSSNLSSRLSTSRRTLTFPFARRCYLDGIGQRRYVRGVVLIGGGREVGWIGGDEWIGWNGWARWKGWIEWDRRTGWDEWAVCSDEIFWRSQVSKIQRVELGGRIGRIGWGKQVSDVRGLVLNRACKRGIKMYD